MRQTYDINGYELVNVHDIRHHSMAVYMQWAFMSLSLLYAAARLGKRIIWVVVVVVKCLTAGTCSIVGCGVVDETGVQILHRRPMGITVPLHGSSSTVCLLPCYFPTVLRTVSETETADHAASYFVSTSFRCNTARVVLIRYNCRLFKEIPFGHSSVLGAGCEDAGR